MLLRPRVTTLNTFANQPTADMPSHASLRPLKHPTSRPFVRTPQPFHSATAKRSNLAPTILTFLSGLSLLTSPCAAVYGAEPITIVGIGNPQSTRFVAAGCALAKKVGPTPIECSFPSFDDLDNSYVFPVDTFYTTSSLFVFDRATNIDELTIPDLGNHVELGAIKDFQGDQSLADFLLPYYASVYEAQKTTNDQIAAFAPWLHNKLSETLSGGLLPNSPCVDSDSWSFSQIMFVETARSGFEDYALTNMLSSGNLYDSRMEDFLNQYVDEHATDSLAGGSLPCNPRVRVGSNIAQGVQVAVQSQNDRDALRSQLNDGSQYFYTKKPLQSTDAQVAFDTYMSSVFVRASDNLIVSKISSICDTYFEDLLVMSCIDRIGEAMASLFGRRIILHWSDVVPQPEP